MIPRTAFAVLALAGLTLAACGSDDPGTTPDPVDGTAAGAGGGSLTVGGSVEEAVGHIEANRTGARCGARRCVGRPQPGGVSERGSVCGQAAGVPGGVARVSTQEGNG